MRISANKNILELAGEVFFVGQTVDKSLDT